MPTQPPPRRRVLILTADVGEGHAVAARALQAALRRRDPTTDVVTVDGVRPLGRLVRWSVQSLYREQLRWAPATYGLLYGLVLRSAPARWLARTIIVACGARGLGRVIDDHAPDIVVSTYPATTAVLGALRRRGRLRVPTAAVVSDFAGVALWIDKDVDRHLVMYDQSHDEAALRVGADRVTCVSPLVDPAFTAERSRAQCRQVLGLPAEGPLVVVSGGGWAVGDLPAAVRAALEAEDVHVVCLAGRDRAAQARLSARFAGERRVTVLGFTDRMPELLHAAAALVHTTAGMTSLEALSCGCPVIAFSAPPGHPRLNAAAMTAASLAVSAEDPAELTHALRLVLSRARPTPQIPGRHRDAATVVLALRAVPIARRRLATTAATLAGAAAASATAAAGIGVLGEGDLRLPTIAAATAVMASNLRGVILTARPL